MKFFYLLFDCSLFGFIVLYMLMYVVNMYFWKRYRVNYFFMFGFKEGMEFGFSEVLFFSFCLSVLVMLSVFVNLDMEMDLMMKDYKVMMEFLFLGLVLVSYKD